MPANKKVRRVRVIEVIDDDEVLEDDLDEVLEALDESDNESDDDSDDSDESEEAAAPAKRATAKRATAKRATARRTAATAEAATPAAKRLLGSPRTTAVLVIVLVAALASLAIWQWRQAAGLAAERAERRAVAEVAGAYGDTAFSYTASTYRTSIDRNLKLLGGDLLATYKRDTIPNLPTVFGKNPQLAMESKIKKVYVGDVNGTLATAVILVDITLRTPQGVNDGSNALLRLSLAKEKGGWKITQQAASGQGDDAASQLPTLPNASATPSDTPSQKPKK